MLASHCSTSGQVWPMKLNGGTRPVLSSFDGQLARVGHAGRLLGPLDAGVFFFLLLCRLPSSRLRPLSSPRAWAARRRAWAGRRARRLGLGIMALACSGDSAGGDREHGLLSARRQQRAKISQTPPASSRAQQEADSIVARACHDLVPQEWDECRRGPSRESAAIIRAAGRNHKHWGVPAMQKRERPRR